MVRRTRKLDLGLLLVVVVVLVAAGICDVSGASTRDKKKNNKTRSDIVAPNNKTETAAGVGAGAANVTTLVDVAGVEKELEATNATATATAVVLTADKDKEKEKDVVVEGEGEGEGVEEVEVAGGAGNADSDKEVVVILEEDKLEELDASNGLETAKPKPHSYMTRIKNLLKRVLNLLGLTRSTRKSRLLSFNQDNSLDSTRADYYTEEVRATVGALLGKRDCLRRAVCGAGSYLRHIKGKEVVIIVLEKIVPSAWKDSVNFIKEAAIYQDRCDYKCVDEEDD